ncbi:MAG: hypothetical protein RIA09_17000 [Hoeflea sp.]|uniref:hypothetical protein n=1 Tax=Hoeflea sp. TaxID=1940281 RepID=UPI0032EFDBF6
MKKLCTVGALALMAFVSNITVTPVFAQSPGYDRNGCGWYIILGCSTDRSAAAGTLYDLGGIMVGGGAGSRILNTTGVEGFRNGFYCVADGPYLTEADAGSVAWREAVPDAYVKRGC